MTSRIPLQEVNGASSAGAFWITAIAQSLLTEVMCVMSKSKVVEHRTLTLLGAVRTKEFLGVVMFLGVVLPFPLGAVRPVLLGAGRPVLLHQHHLQAKSFGHKADKVRAATKLVEAKTIASKVVRGLLPEKLSKRSQQKLAKTNVVKSKIRAIGRLIQPSIWSMTKFATGALILKRAAAVRAIMPPRGTVLVKRHQRFQTLLQRLRQVHHPLLHQQPRRLPLLSLSHPAAADGVPRGAVQAVVGVESLQGPRGARA